VGLKTTQLYVDIPPEFTLAFQIVQQQGVWQGELSKLTKTGQTVIVASRWTLVRDEAGQPQSILTVDTDITATKLLEQQFLRAQRLESLGTLASGIAHDLNNVLTPIQGAAQLLPQILPNLDERGQKLLTMLVESSKRGSSLVKQILTFARGVDGERTVLQVRHILAEILSVARHTFPKSIETILHLPAEDLWLMNVDATQIHQVLMNLFVNARDAMPNGGRLMATAQNLVLDGSGNARAGSYVEITVADTGVGINQKAINKIFDPFFTTKETGTGLGLSTVLGIINAHGGYVTVTSEVGQGTCFTIQIPAVTSSEQIQSIEKTELFDGRGQLVLVVDDEASIREITKDSLETYNYRVMLASEGLQAISVYSQYRDEIAVVMLDMMMPALDTPSIIQALQQLNPAVKIVAMSGLTTNDQIVEQYGLTAFLTKPFTMTAMLQVLAALDELT
jgi:two-component system, cell cycle sensor histidine kinase and response regulator CckA